MPVSKPRRLLLVVGGGVVLAALLVLARLWPPGTTSLPEAVVAQIARSHIEANVPPASDFDAGLARDLRAWFTQRQGSPVTVRFELLRRGSTRSGVAYPKYYA